MKQRFLAAAALVTLLAPAGFAKSDAMSLIPNDAVSVGVVRLADMRTSPLSSMLFQQTDKISTDGDAQKFLTDAGLAPTKDVDVLVVATSPVTNLGSEPEVLVMADGRFNVTRLSDALVARGAVRKNGYFILPESGNDSSNHKGAVAFPDAHLAIAGSESAVIEALAARANGGTTFTTASGLGREIVRIEPHATAWALVDVARAQRLGGAKLGAHNGNGDALASAIKNVSTVAIWATDTGDSLKLGAFGIARDADTLGLLEDTIRGALSALRLAAQDKSPDLVSVLRKFTVSRSGDSITVSGTVPAETVKTLVAKQHASSSTR
jgi:hypothetical protein